VQAWPRRDQPKRGQPYAGTWLSLQRSFHSSAAQPEKNKNKKLTIFFIIILFVIFIIIFKNLNQHVHKSKHPQQSLAVECRQSIDDGTVKALTKDVTDMLFSMLKATVTNIFIFNCREAFIFINHTAVSVKFKTTPF